MLEARIIKAEKALHLPWGFRIGVETDEFGRWLEDRIKLTNVKHLYQVNRRIIYTDQFEDLSKGDKIKVSVDEYEEATDNVLRVMFPNRERIVKEKDGRIFVFGEGETGKVQINVDIAPWETSYEIDYR